MPDAEQAARMTRRTRFQTVAVTVTAVIALAIAGLTLTPSISPPPTGLALTDKAYHAIAFAVLVLPSAAVFHQHRTWIAISAFVYAAIIEVIQPFVGRGAEWADLAANAAGILISIALGAIIQAIARSEQKRPPGS